MKSIDDWYLTYFRSSPSSSLISSHNQARHHQPQPEGRLLWRASEERWWKGWRKGRWRVRGRGDGRAGHISTRHWIWCQRGWYQGASAKLLYGVVLKGVVREGVMTQQWISLPRSAVNQPKEPLRLLPKRRPRKPLTTRFLNPLSINPQPPLLSLHRRWWCRPVPSMMMYQNKHFQPHQYPYSRPQPPPPLSAAWPMTSPKACSCYQYHSIWIWMVMMWNMLGISHQSISLISNVYLLLASSKRKIR